MKRNITFENYNNIYQLLSQISLKWNEVRYTKVYKLTSWKKIELTFFNAPRNAPVEKNGFLLYYRKYKLTLQSGYRVINFSRSFAMRYFTYFICSYFQYLHHEYVESFLKEYNNVVYKRAAILISVRDILWTAKPLNHNQPINALRKRECSIMFLVSIFKRNI